MHQRIVSFLVSAGQNGRRDQEFLDENSANPEYNTALADIFQCEQPPSPELLPQWPQLRWSAAIQLKNNVWRHPPPVESLQHIGNSALSQLESNDRRLQKGAAQIIAKVAILLGEKAAEPLLGALGQRAQQGQFVAYTVLRYLFEDGPEVVGSNTLQIISAVCQACSKGPEALECLLAAFEVSAMMPWDDFDSLTPFQKSLWILCQSSEERPWTVAMTVDSLLALELPLVGRRTCLKLMTLLLDYNRNVPPEVAQRWVQCALRCTQDQQYFLDAALFVHKVCSFAENIESPQELQLDIFCCSLTEQHAASLLPILLGAMIYVDDEVDDILEADDASRYPDKNIRPKKTNRRGRDADNSDDGEVEIFTSRTVATICVQALAMVHPGVVYHILKERLRQGVSAEDWHVRESTILCLGSIFHGCFQFMKSDMGQIVSTLFDRASNDNHVLVRAIACYSLMAAMEFIAWEGTQFLPDAFQVLFNCAQSTSKRVQYNALSAIGTGFAKCSEVNAKLATPIVPLFIGVLPGIASRYQANNLMLLVDLFQVILDKYPEVVQLPACTEFLRVLLDQRVARGMQDLERGDALSINVKEMLYILRPISNLLQASAINFTEQQRGQLRAMCFKCVEFFFSQASNEDTDFVTYPLHLVSVNFEMYPQEMQLYPYAFYSMVLDKTLRSDADPSIQLEALLFLSSLSAISDESFLAEFKTKFLPLLMQLCEQGGPLMCDAVWCLGQCLINLRQRVPPNIVVDFLTGLCAKISSTQATDEAKPVLQTATLTVGRCLSAFPDLCNVIQLQGNVYGTMLKVLRDKEVSNDSHKAVATQGLFQCAQRALDPSNLKQLIFLALSFQDSITKFPQLQRGVAETFQVLGQGPLGQALGGEVTRLTDSVRRKMSQMYGL